MFTQPYDIEKITLVTKRQDLERELQQIALSTTAEENSVKQSRVQHFLEAVGRTLVKFGNRMVARYGTCETNLVKQTNVKTT